MQVLLLFVQPVTRTHTIQMLNFFRMLFLVYVTGFFCSIERITVISLLKANFAVFKLALGLSRTTAEVLFFKYFCLLFDVYFN